jgi:hemin uptake protein HemP
MYTSYEFMGIEPRRSLCDSLTGRDGADIVSLALSLGEDISPGDFDVVQQAEAEELVLARSLGLKDDVHYSMALTFLDAARGISSDDLMGAGKSLILKHNPKLYDDAGLDSSAAGLTRRAFDMAIAEAEEYVLKRFWSSHH